MKSHYFIFKILVLGLLIFTLSGFKISNEDKSSVYSDKVTEIVIANTGNSPELHADICNYISAQLGIKVKSVTVPKMSEMISMFKQGKVDIAFMQTFTYILARDELSTNVEPLVVYGDENGKPGSYHSSLIVPPKGKIKRISDINDNTMMNLSIAFAKPTSTSGHIIPRLYFSAIGYDKLEARFKSVDFAGGHPQVIDMIKNGKADVGACATGYIRSAIKKGKIKSTDVKVIWTSGDIVEGPVVARRAFNSKIKNKIKKIFLNMHISNPALWKKVQSIYPGARSSKGFMEAKDEFYDPIRRLANRMDHLKVILKYYMKKNY